MSTTSFCIWWCWALGASVMISPSDLLWDGSLAFLDLVMTLALSSSGKNSRSAALSDLFSSRDVKALNVIHELLLKAVLSIDSLLKLFSSDFQILSTRFWIRSFSNCSTSRRQVMILLMRKLKVCLDDVALNTSEVHPVFNGFIQESGGKGEFFIADLVCHCFRWHWEIWGYHWACLPGRGRSAAFAIADNKPWRVCWEDTSSWNLHREDVNDDVEFPRTMVSLSTDVFSALSGGSRKESSLKSFTLELRQRISTVISLDKLALDLAKAGHGNIPPSSG